MNQYINVTGWVLGGIPTLAAFIFLYSNRGNPWRFGNLFAALLLLGITTFMLGLLTDTITLVEELHDQKKLSDSVFKELKLSGVIWLAMIPAVAGGVGVNALSDFLSNKKP